MDLILEVCKIQYIKAYCLQANAINREEKILKTHIIFELMQRTL